MDIGVFKPYDVNRATATGVSVDAGLGKTKNFEQVTSISPVDAPSASAQKAEPADEAALVERERLDDAVADMQNYVQSVNRDISFQLDDSSGRVIISVTERSTGEVIRQIPSEEALRIAEKMAEVNSLLFKAEA